MRECLLVFSPHPDDECLAAAGLMQRALRAGAGVHACLMTDGENAPWIQRAYEWRWRIGPRDRERFGRIRREEAVRALAELGLPAAAVRFFHWPDQGLTPLLLAGSEAPVDQIVAILQELQPTLILAPSRLDLHPDHSALAVLLDLAEARLAPGDRPRRRDFLIHRRRATPDPDRIALHLTAEECARKRDALLCYRTQLSVHRRRMFAFQSRVEDFIPARAPQPENSGHAVAAAAWAADELRLRVELNSRLGAHGAAELLLLGARAGRERWCARLPLRRVEDHSPLCDLRTGAEWGTVRVDRRAGGWDVRVPAQALPPFSSLHAKLERSRGFFDQSGWIEIVPPRASRSPQPGIRATHSISTLASFGSLAT